MEKPMKRVSIRKPLTAAVFQVAVYLVLQWPPIVLPAFCWAGGGLLPAVSTVGADDGLPKLPGSGEILIHHLDPDPGGGRAYRLVYVAPAPLDVYWRFKTDFDNDFLLTNRYIRKHRLVSRSGDTVITENRYADSPDVVFRWQTTVLPHAHRLEFVLLNPEACGQRFHYGYITLSPTAEGTRVTQVAYFDFWGASIWATYPWRGGMRHFLLYTARWEQDTIARLRDRYADDPGKQEPPSWAP